METDPRPLFLLSSDGEFVSFPERGAIMCSGLVKTALESDSEVTELPVKVRGSILKLIATYANHHKHDPPQEKPSTGITKPLKTNKMKENCEDEWDVAFIDELDTENDNPLISLMCAANYMEMDKLMHLAAAKAASMVKGQHPDKFESILRIKIKKESYE